MMNTKNLFAALLLTLGLASTAQASLLSGQTVSIQYFYPDLSTPELYVSVNGNFLVNGGVEVPDVTLGAASLDIRDSQLYISFLYSAAFQPGEFNGFKLSVGAGVDDFTSVTIDALSTFTDFDSSRIDFGSDYIFVNWQGLDFEVGNVLALNIGTTQQVPEPASLALLSLALLGFATLRRKA